MKYETSIRHGLAALLLGLGVARSAAALPPPPVVWSDATPLLRQGTFTDAGYGRNVAVSGNRAAITSEDVTFDGRAGQGAIYLFTRSASGWASDGMLTMPNGVAGDQFAYSMALDGDTLLASIFHDPGMDGSAAPPVQVLAFQRKAGAWVQEGPPLRASDGTADDQFGTTIVVSHDTALVLARGADIELGGAVYVFVHVGGRWLQQGPALRHPGAGGAEGRYWGSGLAIFGDTLLIGAATYAGPARNGEVFVYTRTAGRWSQQGPPLLGPPVELDEFGYSVALYGDTALVGSPDGIDGGAAYVFVRSSAGTWSRQGPTLHGVAHDWFGTTVTLWGDQAVIGSPDDEFDDGVGTGVIYGFSRVAGEWSLGNPSRVNAADPRNIGVAISLAGPNVVVGASRADGSAYALRLCATGNCCAADAECAAGEFCAANGSCKPRSPDADPCDCFEPGCLVCNAVNCGVCSSPEQIVPADGDAGAAGEGGAGGAPTTSVFGGAAGATHAGAPGAGASHSAGSGNTTSTGGASTAGAAGSICNEGCQDALDERATAGCGCHLASQRGHTSPFGMVALFGLGAFGLRKRRRTRRHP